MIFNPNIPNPGDRLSVSQPVLKTNNADLDITFGVDHYKFSDGTSNNGKHNKITTPTYVESPVTNLPPTTTADPILYAFQVPAPPTTSNIGLLHFSKGVNDAVPTPLTKIQSTTADSTFTAGQIKDIVDLAGVTRASGYVRSDAMDDTIQIKGTRIHLFFYTPTNNQVRLLQNTSTDPVTLDVFFSGTKLQIRSTDTQSNVYWSLEFTRLE